MLKVLAAVLACLSAAVAITIYTVEVPALKNQINELEIAAGTTVTANPTGTATETLTKLDVDGTIYDLESGTTVTANPTGTATETLTKLDVDGTIYEISSGGGGGGALYCHNINIRQGGGGATNAYSVNFTVINNVSTQYTASTMLSYLQSKIGSNWMMATGYYNSTQSTYALVYRIRTAETTYKLYYCTANGSNNEVSFTGEEQYTTFTDTVYQIN